MKRIIENKSPITLWQIVLALLNYYGGYLYLYPWIATKLIGNVTGDRSIVIVFLVNVLLPLVINVVLLYPLLKESWDNFINEKVFSTLKTIFLGVVILFVGCVAMSLILYYLLGIETSTNQQEVSTLFKYYPLLLTFLAVVFAPIVEETIFRGIFYRIPRKKLGLPLSLILTGVAFGALHIMDAVFAGNYIELTYILVYGLMGVILAMEYETKQNIFVCILTHALYNYLALRMLG